MSTESSLTILVVILSLALAVFLIIGIVATVKIIQILNQLKKIVDKAERIADRAEAVGDFFRRTAGAAAFGKLIANITEAVRNRKRGRK